MLNSVSLLGSPHAGRAQAPAPTYRNLIMKGGGIRGIAYGGALQELESRGVLAHLTRVGGTLAGAIQAALLAIGYSPEQKAQLVASGRQGVQAFFESGK